MQTVVNCHGQFKIYPFGRSEPVKISDGPADVISAAYLKIIQAAAALRIDWSRAVRPQQRFQLALRSRSQAAPVPGTQSATGKHPKARNDEHFEVAVEWQNIGTQFLMRASTWPG